jgi:spermidine/putrescine transport system ATP-binding protein
MEGSPTAAPDAGERPGAHVASAEADIHLQNVTKRFGDHVAVDDLTLSIEPGAFYALLGPSGCGKTTTLRMIGGFEDPTDGVVYLGGEAVTNLPPYKRDVNTVFQSYALFPHLNVERNVAFGLERKGVGKAEARTRVGQALEMVQLGQFAKRKPGQLSGGQAQRVALARALVNRPRALLLDEPLGALDLRLRKQLQIELKKIQQEIGITFVHVTHDQEEAMSMADTIAVMNKGRIEQAGTAEDLYERPRTAFVANFLGISNLVDGKVLERGAEIARVETPDGTISVPCARMDETPGDAIRIGIRPEKVELVPAADGVPAGRNALRGTVSVASFLGVSIQYVITAPNGEELTVIAPNSGAGQPAGLGVGQEVLLTWDPQHTFVVTRDA